VEGRAIDPRSDLYSFGVTCYEMLAGRPPFSGDTPLSVAIQHLRAEPARLESLRPDLPEGLCRIVHQLLAKSPVDRYATPAELMRELRALHVGGVEHWPAGLEEWDTPELIALSDARSEATLRLDGIMKSQARRRHRHVRYWQWTLLLAAGVSLGLLGAWWRQSDDLLTVTAPAVEPQDSAMLQYWYAYDINTEAAWLAVERNFPQDDPLNRVYALQAKQRRAELYRDNDQPDRAMALYAELASLDGEEPQFAAGGLIGQANLLAQQNDGKGASAKLAQALRSLEALPNQSQKEGVLMLLESRVLSLIEDANLRAKIEDLLPAWRPGPEPSGS
jgi:serine/threonine-protein kinase